MCYLNARSVHKHIQDIHKDLNYSATDINIFAETRFSSQDSNDMYNVSGYDLFRKTILIPTMDQDLMVVQLCTVESHT